MATSFVASTPGELRRRRDRITDFLDSWGDLTVTDAGARGSRRRIEFRLQAPGSALPVEVEAIYREYYRLTKHGDWMISKYTYEYLDIIRDHRLAYHLHPVGTRQRVAHAHCEARVGDEPDERHHLRAVELELREAHEEFMRLYAGGSSPDCSSFRPLALPSEPI